MRALVLVCMVAIVSFAAGCGSGSGGATRPSSRGHVKPNAPEVNPSGDIPDSQVYVPFSVPGQRLTLKVPEGWARRATAAGTVFTDNLNSATIRVATASRAPTVSSVSAPKGAHVATVHRKSGTGIVVKYLARSRPDAVTGKTRVDAVERYVFFHRGRELVLTLSGPKGADNVDPWRIITDSLRWTR